MSILAAAAVLAAIFVILAPFVIERMAWRGVVKRRAVVVLHGEQTIEGIVLSRSGPLLTLSDAHVVTPGGPVSVDGNVVVERDRVLWMQVGG